MPPGDWKVRAHTPFPPPPLFFVTHLDLSDGCQIQKKKRFKEGLKKLKLFLFLIRMKRRLVELMNKWMDGWRMDRVIVQSIQCFFHPFFWPCALMNLRSITFLIFLLLLYPNINQSFIEKKTEIQEIPFSHSLKSSKILSAMIGFPIIIQSMVTHPRRVCFKNRWNLRKLYAVYAVCMWSIDVAPSLLPPGNPSNNSLNDNSIKNVYSSGTGFTIQDFNI